LAGTVKIYDRELFSGFEKSDFLFLAALCLFSAIILFAFCWQPGFLDDDSVAYAQTARLVAQTNQWLNIYDPSYGGPFYYHFPLVIWISALIFKAFGVNVISASIFSLLSGLAAVIAIFYFGKLIKNRWVGFFSSSVFLLINFTPRLARQCRMDMPLALFVILSLYFFAKAQQGKKTNYLLFGIFTSLAIMTKDVFGLAPLAIASIFLLFSRNKREFLNPYFLLSLVLAFIPVVSWIILEQRLSGEAMFNKWLNWNFLHLLKSPAFNIPAYYYPLEILKRFFYFVPFFVYGGYLAIKKFLKKDSEAPLLILIWALFIPFVFSFGRQKLHYFIYSAYPAAALLAGLALEKIIRDSAKPKAFFLLVFLISAFGLLELCTPLRFARVYFAQTIKLVPLIDTILEKCGEYDFYTFSQDETALLFYSKKLKNTIRLKGKEELVASLNDRAADKQRFCFLDKPSFYAIKPQLHPSWQVVLEHKDKLLITDRLTQALPLVLSD